ncbi:MAG: hypothetical protein IJ306_08205 [Oscillospiraceae bacterium]|nr:hypothetical protein [Oscillospiraceae bacterium]
MKKTAAFLIIAMVLFVSVFSAVNIFSAKEFLSGGAVFQNFETALSQNIPFRNELSELMDRIRYFSGVRHFGDIYIGSGGSLLRDIENPTSRTFSSAKNYILSFAEKYQTKPYFMLVPTSAVILQQEIENYANENIYNQRSMIARMYAEFEGKVRTTDIYQTLYDHRGEYIYYHTEDLPTSLGGYYIYGELCSRLGLTQNTMDSFSAAYAAHGFYGSLATDFFKAYASPDFITLYEYIGDSKKFVIERFNTNGTTQVSESVFIYNEKLFEDKTDMIFGGLSAVMEVTSAESTGERNSILIFGDESAKSWLPFLISNYERVTFIDLNAANKELLSGVNPAEYGQILFAYSTATFSSGIDFEKLDFVG